MQSKCELKDYTINLCQKTIVEQLSEKFIEVLNASNKHRILVFREQFGQINNCESLLADRKYPKNIMKSISHIGTVTNMFLNYVFF